MNIGILALQGAFEEHKKVFESLGVSSKEIRQKKDLSGIDAIVLPGGESTVQGQLLRKLDIFIELKKLIEAGLPTLATCAGAILLAKKIENDPDSHLATLPVTIKRNAYGRQLGSFKSLLDFDDIKDYPAVFIRAPYFTELGQGVQILSQNGSEIVAIKYKNQLAMSFHPEMTSDTRIHKKFLEIYGNG